METLLVGNPTAQSGRAGAFIDRARAGLEARGLATRFLPTRPAGGTPQAVRDVLELAPVEQVVALGGDGTFAEVARGLLASGRDLPLGLLPAGTANDQARSLGIGLGPDALQANLDVIARGHCVRLDAGRVERLSADGALEEALLFFDSVGWGMHPDVLARRNRDRAVVDQLPLVRELYRDQAVYAGAVLNRYLASWIEPTKFDAVAVVDGRTYRLQGLTDLIVNATPIYAGAWVLARDARCDDGRFELVPIQGRRDWFLKAVADLAALPVLGEQLDAIGVRSTGTVQGTTFELALSRPARPAVTAQVDGEEWGAGSRYRVSVLPRALRVLAPEGWTPPWQAGRA
ncbi:MAG: hypothetical protein M9894_08020 [Planctomycetes bacterium]|nr:hypothetical protein [Planctomycetota bacterium]